MKYITITFLLSMMLGSLKIAAQGRKATAIDTASAYYKKNGIAIVK